MAVSISGKSRLASRQLKPFSDRASPTTGRDSFRPDIQGLRALAVLLVATQHAGLPGVSGGYVGVDVFFVISGFLITGWLLRRADRAGSISLGDFYAARARRILPAATLTLLATAAASIMWLNYVRAISVVHDAVWSALFVANYHFARHATDYFARESPPSPLQHFWTLAVEEQFYLVWPVLLGLVVLTTRRARRGRAGPAPRTPIGVVLVSIIALSLVLSIRQTHSDATYAYFSTLARAWELGVGAFLAVASETVARMSPRQRLVAGWAGLGAIMLAATTYSAGTAFPGYAAALPVTGAALVVASGIGGRRQGDASVLLATAPLRFVGDMSYAFYLWHWPVLIIPMQHVGHQFSLGTNLALLSAAFALSVLTYAVYENPIRHSPLFSKRPVRSLALWPVTVGTVVLSAAVGLAYLHAKEPSPYLVEPLPRALIHGADPAVEAVARNSTPAALRRPVPLHVAPTLAHLIDDSFDLKGCDAGLGSNTTSPICHFGSQTPRHTVVVFGDSHARMWMPAILHWASRQHISIVPLIKEGCMGIHWSRSDTSTAQGACNRWYTWALEQLRTIQPEVAILATAYSNAGRMPRLASRTITGVTRELGDLRQRAAAVVLIEDPPKTEKIPLDCLLRSGATVGSCSFTVPPAWTRTVGPGIAEAVAATGSQFVPTNQWFCQHNLCPVVIDHIVVFLNRGHITSTYARWVAEPFARKMQSVTGL
jgi:peptidoglycan/LPS O-acetylase OafA/YrhL